jgi:hypothetical protein
MHSFFVGGPSDTLPERVEDDAATASAVVTGLNLGVGGSGVVGRTVSVVDEQRVVLGEGIIGWN